MSMSEPRPRAAFPRRRARFVLGALALSLLAAPAARAESTHEYHLIFNTDGSLVTPNPFPAYLTVPIGGQIGLNFDTLGAPPTVTNPLYVRQGVFQGFFVSGPGHG